MSYAYGGKIKEGLSFKNYIFLRLGRIYPLHLFMLFLWLPYILIKQYMYTSGYGGTDQFEASNLSSFISNLVLLQSMGLHSHLSWNGPSWSISTELFAYVIFYILTFLVDKKNKLVLPIIVPILCYLFLFSLGRNNLNITFDYGFIRCLGAFYIGVFLFRIRPYLVVNINSIKSISIIEIASILFVVVAVTYSGSNYLSIIVAIFSFMFVLLVFSTEKNGFLGKLLENKRVRAIGIWSYSIYMIHSLVLNVISNIFKYIFKYDLNSALGFESLIINASMLTITIIISRYTYIHIEKKFRDLVKSKVIKYNKTH